MDKKSKLLIFVYTKPISIRMKKKIYFVFLLFVLLISNKITFSITVSDTVKSPKEYNLYYGDSLCNFFQKYYQTQIKIAHKNGEYQNEALINIYLAGICRLKDRTDSIKYYLAIAKQIIDKHQINNQRLNLELQKEATAEIYFWDNKMPGKWEKYLTAINQSILLAKTLKGKESSDELIGLFSQKASAFQVLEKFDSALIYLNKIENLFTKQTKPKDLIKFYIRKNVILRNSGLKEEAFLEAKKAYSLINVKDYSFLNASVIDNLAEEYYNREDRKKALDLYLMALDQYKHLLHENSDYILKTYENIGTCYRNLKDYNTAIEFFKKTAFCPTYNKRHSLYNLALSYRNIDSIQQADKYFRLAIKHSLKNSNLQKYNFALRSYAYAKFCKEHFDKHRYEIFLDTALIYLKKIATIENPQAPRACSRISEIYISNEAYKTALLYCNKGLSLNLKDQHSAFSSKNVSDLKAHAFLLKNKIIALKCLLKDNLKTNDKEKYIDELKSTIDLCNNVLHLFRKQIKSRNSRQSNTGIQKRYYNELIKSSLLIFDITNDSSYYFKSYQFAIENKSATLQEIIEESVARIQFGVSEEENQKEKLLNKNINALQYLRATEENKSQPDYQKIEKFRKDYLALDKEKDELINRIEKNNPEYYKLKYDQSLPSIKEIQNSLDTNQCIIEYFLSDEQVNIFLTKNSGLKIITKEINESFYNHLSFLINYHNKVDITKFDKDLFQKFKNYSYDLYKILIEPIKSNISNSELIIIPDDQLWYLPFETLITKNNKNDYSYSDLSYLLIDHPIRYSYSAKYVNKDSHKQLSPSRKILTIVPSYDPNIDYEELAFSKENNNMRVGLEELPASIEEAKYVHKVLGGKLLTGKKASEKTFKKIAEKYSILHLAMHAIINNENPNYSRLIFSHTSDTIEDSYLNTYEIFDLQLNAQMTVLSSCKSGSGKMHKGEGIISIARAFLYAGCPSLVMTLWSVDDDASAKLMHYYYDFLVMGNTKSVALQKAKLKFLKSATSVHKHPYFWASYTLIGDNKPIILYKNYNYYYVIGGILLLILLLRKRISKLFKIIK